MINQENFNNAWGDNNSRFFPPIYKKIAEAVMLLLLILMTIKV